MTAVVLTVLGVPAPQGSKRAVGTRLGRRGQRVTVLAESSKALEQWRAKVAAATHMWVGTWWGQWSPLDGPVKVSIDFTVPAPARIPASRLGRPATTPDLDKLIRATFDALTVGRIWTDDSRVVEVTAREWYPDLGPGALSQPGARIEIEPIVGLTQRREG